jgi:hypothetical protein
VFFSKGQSFLAEKETEQQKGKEGLSAPPMAMRRNPLAK